MILEKEKIACANGKDILSYTITNKNGFSVEILNLGGIIIKIMAADKYGEFKNIVVGYKDLNNYFENRSYFGALIGRTAGRIHKGYVNIGDKEYKFSINSDINQCHGGFEGFHTKVWDIDTITNDDSISLKLSTSSKDKEEGYPGNVMVSVTYTVDENNNLTIEYEGKTDKTTLMNLTNHTYFNLSGDICDPITDQYIKIDSNYIVEINKDLVPTGNLISVENTPFDFRLLKRIGESIDSEHYQIKAGNGYDHPWILNSEENQVYACDKKSGRCMTVSTDQEAIVFYSMNFVTEEALYNGRENQNRYAMCLETQKPPIGVNGCFKEKSILNPDEVYIHKTIFSFGVE